MKDSLRGEPTRFRWLFRGIAVGLIVGAGGSRVHAQSVQLKTDWASGDALLAEDLNSNFRELDRRLSAVESLSEEMTSVAADLSTVQAAVSAFDSRVSDLETDVAESTAGLRDALSMPNGVSSPSLTSGSVAVSNAHLQGGTWAGPDGVLGNSARIDFPTPFVHGVLTVLVSLGDNVSWENSITADAVDIEGFSIRTQGLPDGAAIRVNWIAVGW